MASSSVPEIVTGYPIPSSLATPPPRRRWWSRPIVTIPPTHVREATCMETTVCCTPCWAGLFTILAVYLLLFHVIDNARCHAKFSIQSIAVSPSSATWHLISSSKTLAPAASVYSLAGTLSTTEPMKLPCHNLTRSYENVERIQCHSSYTKLETLIDG
ncbi:unnamed protein product [Arabidopsis lyrata]|nr:unnamed protein product [Arabidopsis lyrata]